MRRTSQEPPQVAVLGRAGTPDHHLLRYLKIQLAGTLGVRVGGEERLDIDAGPRPRSSLEHRYWARRAAEHFAAEGFEVAEEHAVPGDGTVDLMLTGRDGGRVSVEVETGKSDTEANLTKLAGGDVARVVLLATNPAAASRCQEVVRKLAGRLTHPVEILTWLDLR